MGAGGDGVILQGREHNHDIRMRLGRTSLEARQGSMLEEMK